MDCKELKQLIEAWEVVGVEFKSRRLLTAGRNNDDRDETIASAIVSLTNRLGGVLIIGVDPESHVVERGEFDDREGAAQLVAYANRDRISPSVELVHNYLSCDGGEVMVVAVPKRKSMPHSVVRKKGSEVRERVFYVRNNQGKQLVSDIELRQMFLNVDFPEIRSVYPFAYSYQRDPPGGVFFPDLPGLYVADTPFSMALQNAKKEDLDITGKEESDRVRGLISELFPYAILSVYSWGFPGGWESTRIRAGIAVLQEIKGGIERKIGVADLPKPPPSSLLSKIITDFDKFASLLLLTGASFPPGTEVSIEFSPGPAPSSKLILRSPGLYEMTIGFTPTRWNLGLPFGHPLRLGFPPNLKADEPLGSVSGIVDTHFELAFGGPNPERL